MSTFLLEIVTPERIVYTKEVDMVSVKGVEGELGIMAGHVPLVTPLKVAPIRVKKDGNVEELAVHGGFIQVGKDKVVILAESAELSNEIDLSRAKAARERAERRLASKKDEFDHRRAELALQRAMARIEVGEHRSS
ncbi:MULTISPECIES: F0F1 ATP synthase subunit epsilon [unclassified Paenibacillus]|uniref:F0F1 ATP synthase subunit epsilon n=1 Tax=unclassified Paenibacillus TaxID=185978 RepID=UPI001C104717|nr:MULTISPECIES: F0F1 ATP synthase subunit epsilon [unclassified Paenibacillus]MBU5441728.1 F0F1 ATP synthase subunit epsilon [Paenibacillus sp. MSJ-34]CAH0118079.1 ATP synthase epsilon chain [Paenibacillus sp. CECT 9249]